MASLPPINFSEIADTAKAAIQAYGTPVLYKTPADQTGRLIKAVIYKDNSSESLLQDADSRGAMALMDPDDFPAGPPEKFASITATLAGFSGHWTLVDDGHPIIAADTLPLFIVELRRN